MYRNFLFIFLCLLSFTSLAQSVKIDGYAPGYIDKAVVAYEIEDYFSYYEKPIARATVEKDSMFHMTIKLDQTKKIVLRSKNNKTFLYAQPNGTYKVFMPEKDTYAPNRRNGNEVELTFFGLDSTDINYKILGFQRWVDYFVGDNFYRKNVDTTNADYASNLDKFKESVQKYYEKDTSSYLKTYIKFTVAGLDNVQHAAERNRYEKYDFYIKGHPISYDNDVYMDYIKGFYQNLLPRLHDKINEETYQGILNESPTMIMHALGYEYTLKNFKIREMIMLKMLSEVYYSGDYPQTNILTVMDSVANHGLSERNRTIAKNLKARLTELVPGIKAPDFVVKDTSGVKTLSSYRGKYVYVHFIDPESAQNRKDLILLKDLYNKYSQNVEFVSVYKESDQMEDIFLEELNAVDWGTYGLKQSNSIWKNYQVISFPHYVLIDPTGHIVASPALAPTPNGQYETIDKTFFLIQKALERRGN